MANLLAAMGGTENLGLAAGVRYHLTTHGIWGFALISSPTLRSAIDIGLRYVDMTFAFCPMHQRERDGEVQLVLGPPDVPPALRRFVVEHDSSAVQTIQRDLFASPVRIHRAAFTFAAPVSGAERFTEIFGVEPRFDAPENMLVVDPELLDLPLPQADEHTTAMAQAQCRELLSKRAQRSGVAGQVRDLILARPGEPPDLPQIAMSLQLSEGYSAGQVEM